MIHNHALTADARISPTTSEDATIGRRLNYALNHLDSVSKDVARLAGILEGGLVGHAPSPPSAVEAPKAQGGQPLLLEVLETVLSVIERAEVAKTALTRIGTLCMDDGK